MIEHTIKLAMEFLKDIVETAGMPDTYYSVDVSTRSDNTKLMYKAYIPAQVVSKEALFFTNPDPDEFIKTIRDFRDKKLSIIDVKILHHQMQIGSNQVTIDHHKARVAALERERNEQSR